MYILEPARWLDPRILYVREPALNRAFYVDPFTYSIPHSEHVSPIFVEYGDIPRQ